MFSSCLIQFLLEILYFLLRNPMLFLKFSLSVLQPPNDLFLNFKLLLFGESFFLYSEIMFPQLNLIILVFLYEFLYQVFQITLLYILLARAGGLEGKTS